MAPDHDFSQHPELAFNRLVWRVDALDQWREKVVDPKLVLLSKELDGLVKADEVAEAVTRMIQEKQTVRLTRVQTAIATIVSASAVAGFVLSVVGHP